MTTLTPEKEAELRELIPCGKEGGCVLDFDDGRCTEVHDTCLFAKIVSIAEQKLSTERHARETAESDAENLAHRLVTTLNRAEAAEKEVEGWRAFYGRQTALAGKYAREAAAREAAEAKLAALSDLAHTSSGMGVAIWSGDVLRILSALPPPVPTEEAEPFGLSQGSEAWPDRTQAPQDVAGLVEGDLEWLEGETALSVGVKYSRVFLNARDMAEHNARIDRILSALRPSPISHEERPLELAAADNNRESEA